MIPRGTPLIRHAASLHSLRRLLHSNTTKPTSEIEESLRQLLRKTAQPVVIMTALLHPDKPQDSQPQYHGATLSSFSSVSMHPLPLVAFSLRVPSRMASSIHDATRDQSPSLLSTPHLIINVLSASQANLAVRFARADLYPTPFRDTPYDLSEEGIPILRGSLGALSCRVVAYSPLDKVVQSEDLPEDATVGSTPSQLPSELFLARVTRVEQPRSTSDIAGSGERLPLIYHDRRYRSVGEEVPAVI